MDVAKRLADWRDQPPEQWFTAINRYLPPGVTALLVIAIAYQLATLTWTLVPGSALRGRARLRARRPTTTRRLRRTSVGLTDSHLFGEAAEQAAPVVAEVIDAPDTTLEPHAQGHPRDRGRRATAASSSPAIAAKTRLIKSARAIDGADGATLHSVYADRVLLNRNGRLETLRLPKELAASGAPMAMASPLPQAARRRRGSLREAISENATRLTDIVRLAPHVQEGQVVGFRVNPGRDRAAFEALGLQPGDVVTDINGTVLDDPSQGLQVFQSLGEATQANVTVLRDGVPQVIVIDTTQLQSLQENRE